MDPTPYDGVRGDPPPRYGSLEVGYNLRIGGEPVGAGRIYSKLATDRFPNPARVSHSHERSKMKILCVIQGAFVFYESDGFVLSYLRNEQIAITNAGTPFVLKKTPLR